MVVGLSSFANMFQEVKVQVMLTDGEISCLHQIIHGQSNDSGPVLFDNSNIFSSVSDDRDKLVAALEKLSVVCNENNIIINYLNYSGSVFLSSVIFFFSS